MSISLPVAQPAQTARLPRQVEPHPWPGAVLAPVRLELGPLPVAQAYVVSSFWEERLADGVVQRTSIEKTFRLSATRHPGHIVLSYAATGPPTLRKPDLTALEKAMLLLSDLYQRLELQVAPDGQLLAVLNQAEVQQTWERVRTELIQRSGGEDAVTNLLLSGIDEQLQQPQSLLASLRYDYLFGFLLKNIYQQRFESDRRYEQAQIMPHFFAGVDLWCWERLELALPPAPGRVALYLSGTLDRDRTELAAVTQQMLAAQAAAAGQSPAAPLVAANPADLCFAYDATYDVDVATGWPVSVEASIRCWLPAMYSKEYFLRLEVVS